MFSIRPTYSAVGILIAFACQQPLWIAMLVAGSIEFLTGLFLLVSLMKTDKFEYDSIQGKILSQLTIAQEVGLDGIITVIGIRLASYIIAGFGYWPIGLTIYLATIIHYMKNEKPS